MLFVYNGYVYDDDFVKKLNRNCEKVQAHHFNEYLANARYGGISPLEQLNIIRKELNDFQKVDNEKTINFSQEQLLQIVKDFYESLNTQLSQQVNSILNRENPNPNYKVEIITDRKDPCFGISHVGHSNLNTHLDVNISLDGSVEGLRVAAHELSHAISFHHTKKIEIAQQNDQKKLMDFLHYLGEYSRDCINEIESHIIEYLFMEFLVDRGIISNDDFKNFEAIRHNSLLNNIDLIREEYQILKNVSCPITVESFQNFVKKINTPLIKTNRYKSLMNRSKLMAERKPEDNTQNHYSQYRYRYVIGEIVSTLWYENYSQSSKDKKQEMIDKFVEYLSITDTLSLETACNYLLGLKIGDTFECFISHIQAKTV
ncbi:MAG: hypothetical protein IJW36_03425 [Clostridia bacterium]|nr:hypothetical protein [Clostridia bacterium]